MTVASRQRMEREATALRGFGVQPLPAPDFGERWRKLVEEIPEIRDHWCDLFPAEWPPRQSDLAAEVVDQIVERLAAIAGLGAKSPWFPYNSDVEGHLTEEESRIWYRHAAVYAICHVEESPDAYMLSRDGDLVCERLPFATAMAHAIDWEALTADPPIVWEGERAPWVGVAPVTAVHLDRARGVFRTRLR